jgi:lactobin A/cerein 7B family class IIb bacteriocin
MSEMRELTDMEVESVSGGVYDLGAYITRAVDNAMGAATGGNPGNAPTPNKPFLIEYANPAVL